MTGTRRGTKRDKKKDEDGTKKRQVESKVSMRRGCIRDGNYREKCEEKEKYGRSRE